MEKKKLNQRKIGGVGSFYCDLAIPWRFDRVAGSEVTDGFRNGQWKEV
jgi:hypothetical protein